MHETFANALKAFRRNAHVHQGAWRCIIICANQYTLNDAWAETVNTLHGSSLAKGMTVYTGKRSIEWENGTYIRLCRAFSLDELDLRLRGMEVPHVVFVNVDDADFASYATKFLRSKLVAPEAYKIHVTKL